MRNNSYLFLILIYLFISFEGNAKTNKYRAMWRDDPSTTMVIGWNQVSGTAVEVHYDVHDYGDDVLAYQFSVEPSATNISKGMHNYFVRLDNLTPSTLYHFVIKDSEGCSERMSFQTAPDNPDERLSIIAGGDSRNYREARQKANSLVAKLRPHCVMFGGDMTGGDNAKQWDAWFDDWQKTISEDGRLTPLIITRGNHEYSNKTLTDLFDVAPPEAYYALSLGGNLLRIYTLNSLIPSGGNQKKWLENDLQQSQDYIWKAAQYHYAIRPHTAKKSERNNQLKDWATLFEKYQVNLAVESDAHCVKWTYPIRPSRESGSDEGFIRDDEKGTVYVGEGCWGAPLRSNNDDKKWTRNSGSFNQFKWIFIDRDRIEIRTVKTDHADLVSANQPWDVFAIPSGLELWKPSNGDVIVIEKQYQMLANVNYPSLAKFVAKTPEVKIPEVRTLAAKTPKAKNMAVVNFDVAQSQEGVVIKWNTENELDNDKNFEIQRSTDAVHFETIATIKSKGSGNHKYDFFEIQKTDFSKNISYRLSENISDDSYRIYGSKTIENGFYAALQKMNKLTPESRNGMIKAKYVVAKTANVAIRLVDREKKIIAKSDYKNLNSGNYLQSIDMKKFPEGEYLLTIQADEEVIQKYLVVK
jgi:purple acid phosphatase-like protein/calcineurin-like phosphoesterase family protein